MSDKWLDPAPDDAADRVIAAITHKQRTVVQQRKSCRRVQRSEECGAEIATLSGLASTRKGDQCGARIYLVNLVMAEIGYK